VVLLLPFADESANLIGFERILLTYLRYKLKEIENAYLQSFSFVFVLCWGSAAKFPLLLWVRIPLCKNRALRSTLQINGILA
jgi:hypothetical protein